MSNPPNLLQRLRQQAELIRLWEKFELGQQAPKPMDYELLANLLDEAGDRIVQLERDR
jgi:hypothetical protein